VWQRWKYTGLRDFCIVSKQINVTLLEIKREGNISLHRWRYLCDIVPYQFGENAALFRRATTISQSMYHFAFLIHKELFRVSFLRYITWKGNKQTVTIDTRFSYIPIFWIRELIFSYNIYLTSSCVNWAHECKKSPIYTRTSWIQRFLFDKTLKGSKSLTIFKISLTFRFDKVSHLSKSVYIGENSDSI
jgi:hypothetical protein